MSTLKIILSASLGAVIPMTLVSCALPPTTPAVAPVPAPEVAKKEPVVPEPLVDPAPALNLPGKNIPMPDTMLDLPADGDFRAPGSLAPKINPPGAVTSRPPTDPPSRVKPKEPEGE